MKCMRCALDRAITALHAARWTRALDPKRGMTHDEPGLGPGFWVQQQQQHAAPPPASQLPRPARGDMAKGANSDYHHTSPKGVSLFGGIHIRGHATGRRMAAGSPRSSCCYPPRPGSPPCQCHSPGRIPVLLGHVLRGLFHDSEIDQRVVVTLQR